MKPGVVLERQVVAAALKKTERYGVTGFAEIRKPETTTLLVGIEGMT